MQLFVLISYLIVVVALGFSGKKSTKRRDTTNYLLAGRKLSLPGFVVTLVSTWYGGIIGIGENTYLYGFQTWTIFGLPYYIFAIIFAFFVAGKINNLSTISLPDQFYQHYGKVPGVIGAIYILILSSPAPYLLSVGILVNHITGLNYEISLILITLISVSYIWNGGLKAVIRTDIFQFISMFFGFALLLFFSAHFSDFSLEIFKKIPSNHFHPTGGASGQYIAAWFFIALWTFVDPGFYQRCAAAKSPRTARNGILLSVCFWLVFDMLTLFSGLYARALISNGNPSLAYIQLAELVLPQFAIGIFFIGILSVIMSTIDSLTFISATTFGRDIMWRIQKTQNNTNTSETEDTVSFVKKGILVTILISLMIAISIPSVVQIWYTLGSIIVPGLLLPFLMAFSNKKLDVITMMVAPLIISILWIINKNIFGVYPLGLEPFYPGICTSMLICAYKWLKK
ncbi:MAG: sodium:solute symporter [Candidatus Neomarinimicrobiota bacterium]|tara:strand:- start:5732 stop:7096 length:1365 start_codon:yes stop_codon:yes gene_type:complete